MRMVSPIRTTQAIVYRITAMDHVLLVFHFSTMAIRVIVMNGQRIEIMNQKNAEMTGRACGQAYQRILRGRNSPISEDQYKQIGDEEGQKRARSVKSRDLFVKGWNSVWEEPKVIEHNPSSRFCNCPKCMED